MEPIEQAIAAAEKDWSSLPFAKTDTTPFDAKKDMKPDPHAKTGYATVRGWNGKERLLVENIESRLPSGKEAEQRQDEIAGRLPGKVGAALGISEEEAKIKTRQFIALHELGHCKDYSAIKEALNAHSVGKYAEWSRQNPELAKAVPQDMSDAMKNGVNGNDLKTVAKSEAVVGELESSADVFAINAGHKAGLWDRNRMIKAVKEWRKPISFDDMEHDTRHALELAKQNPGKDHNDIAKLERKSLAAMPGKPDGFEWDDNGQPKGISQDYMFKLKRRETLTGMDITETSPDVEKQATASNSNNVFQRAKEEQSSVAENKNESRNRFGLN